MSTPDAEAAAIVSAGGDADDVLRAVVDALAARYGWAGISFVEAGELVLGPHSAGPRPDDTAGYPVVWQGERVAEVWVSGAPEEDRTSLGRVADLVAGHCLVGWDTGGEAWEP